MSLDDQNFARTSASMRAILQNAPLITENDLPYSRFSELMHPVVVMVMPDAVKHFEAEIREMARKDEADKVGAALREDEWMELHHRVQERCRCLILQEIVGRVEPAILMEVLELIKKFPRVYRVQSCLLVKYREHFDRFRRDRILQMGEALKPVFQAEFDSCYDEHVENYRHAINKEQFQSASLHDIRIEFPKFPKLQEAVFEEMKQFQYSREQQRSEIFIMLRNVYMTDEVMERFKATILEE